MHLNTFLERETQERRILIVSSAVKGNRLLRRYESEQNRAVVNVQAMTTERIAEQLFYYDQAQYGPELSWTLLSMQEAVMVFRGVLLRHAAEMQYFSDPRMFNLQTAAEMYRKAVLIRENGLRGQAPGTAGIADLQVLNDLYEKELEQRRMMDETALYRYLMPRIDEDSIKLFGSAYAVLKEDTDRLSGLRKKFLETCFGNRLECVCLFEEDLPSPEGNPLLEQAVFFRGYGSYNEAAYVADDIAAHGYPLGQVLILHTTETQVQPLQAALSANGLSVRFLSPHSAKNDPYLSLVRDVLNWAADDYSEKALEKILAGNVLQIEGTVDEQGTTGNLVGGSSYFEYVTEASERYSETERMVLGWGYARNAAFIIHESAEKYHQKPELLQFHRDLLDIFGSGSEAYTFVQPIVLFRGIRAFLQRYTKQDRGKTAFLAVLDQTERAVSLEERDLPLPEAIDLLGEILSGIRITDTESAEAISVCQIGDWIVPGRPYVYLIGLALKDMQGNSNESPVIRDDDMRQFIGDGWIPTVRAQAELAEKNLYRTLGLFRGKQIAFGCTSFDTINIRAAGPSSFYRNMQRLSGTDEAQEFVYGNPEDGLIITAQLPEETPENNGLPETASASSAGELVKCPRQYWYRKIQEIPENEFSENDPTRWLQANDTGSFFHTIAEQYVKQKLIRPGSESYDTYADRDLLRVLFEDLKDVYRTTAPADSEGLIEQETEELLADTITYFDEVHTALTAGGEDYGWRILFAEEHFRKAPWTIEYAENKAHTFICSGTIDRIDYRVDEDTNAVHLRIVDYKTGKQKNKIKEDEEAALLQHAMYYRALMDDQAVIKDGKTLLQHTLQVISALEGRDVSSMHCVFDGFRYEFPRDTERWYTIARGDLEGLNMTRLKMTMQEIAEKGFYPNVFELFDLWKQDYDSMADPDVQTVLEIMEKQVGKLQKQDGDPCRYCSYGRLCSRQGVTR